MKKRKKLKVCMTMAAAIAAVFSFCQTTFAAEQGIDPQEAIQKLTTFILGIVSAIGVIALIWGGVQLALALKSQDSSQRTNAILFLAGGAIMFGIQFVLQAMGVDV